jgi:RNA polymerase sigma-70 factor (ECF subfamily)
MLAVNAMGAIGEHQTMPTTSQPGVTSVRVAFEDVFEAHFATVYGYLRRRAGDAAEDLAAETFSRAFTAYPRFDPAYGDPRPWLLGIATNVVQGHRRSEARRMRAYAREAGRHAHIEDTVDVPGRVDAADDARRAAKAIARLSRGDRDVLLLVAWADLTSEEVAAALQIPSGTVRSRLSRARAAVRAHMKEDR